MRICLVYDCLFPWTVGGAERWYRNLGERLAAEGHEVTYLTLRQWDRGATRRTPACGSWRSARAWRSTPEGGGGSCRRSCSAPACSGTCCATAAATTSCTPPRSRTSRCSRRRSRGGAAATGLVVDWHEVWSRSYWREYLGGAGGRIGEAVQRVCMRLPQRAFCFSRLHRDRLRVDGPRRRADRARGRVRGRPRRRPRPAGRAGRGVRRAPHPGEARARARPPRWPSPASACPSCGARSSATGPRARTCSPRSPTRGWRESSKRPGFVEAERVDAALRRALCMVLPSTREGYGLVVVEASARGTPSVVVAGRRQRGDRARRRRRERRRRRFGRAPRTWRRRSSASTRKGTRCASARGAGSRATPAGSRWRARSTSSSAATPSAARARSSRPSARRCAPT